MNDETSQALEKLKILGLAFHLDGLHISSSTLIEVELLASQIAKHIRYTGPSPKRSFIYIEEVSEAPNKNGYIERHRNVPTSYWLPKLLLDDFRELEHTLWEIRTWTDVVQFGT